MEFFASNFIYEWKVFIAGIFCEFCEIFQLDYSIKYLWTAASDPSKEENFKK